MSNIHGLHVIDITKQDHFEDGLVIRVESNDDEVKLYFTKQLCVRMTHEQYKSVQNFFRDSK